MRAHDCRAVGSLFLSLTPAVHAVSARFGVRRVAIAGTLLDGALLALLPLAPSLPVLYCVHACDALNSGAASLLLRPRPRSC